MENKNTTEVKKWHDIHAVNDGLFNSSSGHIINIQNPISESINGWDICKGLAYTARFGGQTMNYYSVAQHTILVKYLAPHELKKAALIHDASEAYLGDVIKPLKVILGDVYGNLEKGFMNVIAEKYGVDQRELDAVKEYDLMAVEIEHKAFQQGFKLSWIEWWDRNIGTPVTVWQPEYAFDQLLRHWVSMFGEESQIRNMRKLEEELKTEEIRKGAHHG